jgi:hypothetical protein
VPESVRDRLAVMGYWYCCRDLRDKLDGWDELDEVTASVTEKDLGVLGSALVRF